MRSSYKFLDRTQKTTEDRSVLKTALERDGPQGTIQHRELPNPNTSHDETTNRKESCQNLAVSCSSFSTNLVLQIAFCQIA